MAKQLNTAHDWRNFEMSLRDSTQNAKEYRLLRESLYNILLSNTIPCTWIRIDFATADLLSRAEATQSINTICMTTYLNLQT